MFVTSGGIFMLAYYAIATESCDRHEDRIGEANSTPKYWTPPLILDIRVLARDATY
jgi:hypothetical protein